MAPSSLYPPPGHDPPELAEEVDLDLEKKRRILELYANVIEMGPGIYGVEAASQHYFRVNALGLTREQSAMLAAVLPNPKGWDPTKPGGTLRWRQRRILERERNANFPERLLR